MIFAVDLLLRDSIGLVEVGIVLLKVGVAFVLLLLGVMLMIWFERKFISDMQNRIGPNLAGPFGIFQTLADGIKLFFKEDQVPAKADPLVFRLAPYLALVPAFLIFTVVPIGGDFSGGGDGTVTWWGRQTFLQVADPPIGFLIILAMSSMAVYGVLLAGWASGSKYPLFSAIRVSAQMVSYEVALGLSFASVLLMSKSFSTHDIVLSQGGYEWNLWMTGLVPFFIFLLAVTAEMNRPPFDLVEAEQELVGGFHTEYSSLRFALFYLAEFMNVITMSGVIVTLFLGGPEGPEPFPLPGWLWGIFWFCLKMVVFLAVFVWFRATLPRFRYDQLMNLGWKLLIPLSLVWFLALATLQVSDNRDWNDFIVLASIFGGFVLVGLLLKRALKTAAHNPDPDLSAPATAENNVEENAGRNTENNFDIENLKEKDLGGKN